MYRKIVVSILATVAMTGLLRAQEDSPLAKTDDSVQKLDATVIRMAAYLKSLPAYHVEVSQQWKLDGEQASEGANVYQLTVRNPDEFRVAVTSQAEGPKGSLICVSDGKNLTRLFTLDDDCIYSQREGGLSDLLKDAMTEGTLRESWLGLVSHPDLHHYVMATASDVKYLGEEDLPSGKAHLFQMGWDGVSGVKFWIGAGDKPVVLQAVRTLEFAPEPDKKHQMVITTSLTWKTDGSYPDEMFRPEIPDGAVKVSDLQMYLVEGGTRDLLGQAAPAVDLKQLDGSAWMLNEHKGKDVVVLFFWATWAAPSTQNLPAISKFVKKYEEQGVAFYAVDVGQKEDEVKAFLSDVEYDAPVVLDPQQAAAKAYRVTSLPATVMIGKDGTLQAVHVGSDSESRELISQDLQRVLKGESLIAPNDVP